MNKLAQLVNIVTLAFGLASTLPAAAGAPVWSLDQVYTNADGTVQFLVFSATASGQQHLAGQVLTVTGEQSRRGVFGQVITQVVTHTFAFPDDLPGDSANRHFLVATQGFADQRLVGPDYVVPNGFLLAFGGQVSLAGNPSVAYPAAPTDGMHSLHDQIVDPTRSEWVVGYAEATNFGGDVHSFQPSTPPPDGWELTEAYSNRDGSVQFAVFSTTESNQQFLRGRVLTTMIGLRLTETSRPEYRFYRSYPFPKDLPGDSGNRSFLVATQGFADRAILKPDFVVPNGFLPLPALAGPPPPPYSRWYGGKIILGTRESAFFPLPTDGVSAIWWDDVVRVDTAIAENFAGAQYSFGSTAPSPPPAPPPPPPAPRSGCLWRHC